MKEIFYKIYGDSCKTKKKEKRVQKHSKNKHFYENVGSETMSDINRKEDLGSSVVQ